MFVGLFEALAPIAFGLIVLSCSAEDSWADTLMGNRPIYLLGEISFSIYIVHRLVLELGQLAATGSTSSTDVVSMMVALVAVIPIAWLTWRYVELPFQAWGRRVAKKNSPKPLSAPLGSTAPEAM
jgi:peptidoglycan/LPS O-acetylase OafA/YrhL